jgi:galactonate dehydratase
MSALTTNSVPRRKAIGSAFRAVGLASLSGVALEARQQAERNAPISPKDNLKITKLETFLVKPRWLFLKVGP